MEIDLFTRRGIKYVTDTDGLHELELTPEEQELYDVKMKDIVNARKKSRNKKKSKSKMKKKSRKRNR